jgi:hypothetical protein
MTQAVVLFLDACVGHASNSRSLLWQTQEVGSATVGATAWCFDTLRTAVVRTAIPETSFSNTLCYVQERPKKVGAKSERHM